MPIDRDAPEGTPEEIAQAWDEEIARRIDDFEAGKTKGIPAEEVFAETRASIANYVNCQRS